MSTNVVVVAPDVRRATVKVNPGTFMIDVLQEACKKLNLDSNKWLLKHQKKEINLSDPFRVTRLTAGARLELVAKSKTTSVVNIALKLPESEAKDIPNGRLMEKFRSDTTLWKMLRQFEANGGPGGRSLNFTDRGIPQTSNGMQAGSGQLYYEMPVLRIMNREVSTLADFQKTLSMLGLNSGSHMIQLTFKSTEKTLTDAMQEISQFFKDEEAVVAKEKDAAKAAEKSSVAESSAATEPSVPPVETTDAQQEATRNTESYQAATQETKSTGAADGADDTMDIDEPTSAARDVLQPTGVFSAPTNPTPAAASIDLPDSVYTPTIAHAQAHQQKLLEKAVNRRLKSDAELEAEARAEEAKVASVKTVSVKVRFPDETSAQWSFGPEDTGATLYKAVRGVMANESAPFKLVLPGPPTATSHIKNDAGVRHTLIRGYRLSGRVLVNFVWDDSVPQTIKKQPFLKQSIASQARQVEVPEVPTVVDEPETSAPPPSASAKHSSSDESKGGPKKMPKWLKGLGGKK